MPGKRKNESSSTVYVTGGAESIGKEVAKAFCNAGVKTVICLRCADVGEAAAAEPGANCHYIQADIAKDDDIKKLIDSTISKFGQIGGRDSAKMVCLGSVRNISTLLLKSDYSKLREDIQFVSQVHPKGSI